MREAIVHVIAGNFNRGFGLERALSSVIMPPTGTRQIQLEHGW